MPTFKIGDRVQTAPKTVAWKEGDRYGTVEGFDAVRVRVRLDKSGRVYGFWPTNLTLVDSAAC